MFSKIFRVFYKQNNALSRFALVLKRKYRVAQFNKKEQKVLEISGGDRPLSSDYLNVDISEDPMVDLQTNLLDPLPFETESIDRIVSIATLEHFNIPHIRMVLKEMFRVLKRGGVLEIGVPSLSKTIAQYQKEGCTDTVIRYLHGAQKDEYDVHYFVVDPERFISELHAVGFSEAYEEEYDFPRHSPDYMMKLVAKK